MLDNVADAQRKGRRLARAGQVDTTITLSRAVRDAAAMMARNSGRTLSEQINFMLADYVNLAQSTVAQRAGQASIAESLLG